MAHLMRRAGFGAGRDELEARVAKGYEATVEELLHPETQPAADPYTLLRYQPASLLPGGQPPMGNLNWMFYLVNTKRPLEEKTALFWHHVFATGNSKVDNYDQLLEQINIFRERGLGNHRDPLLEMAGNPTMILSATSRTTGQRSSEGVASARAVQPRRRGTHRTDVRECCCFHRLTRTGPRAPYGRFPKFESRPETTMTARRFFGHKGKVNGNTHQYHRTAGLRSLYLPAPVQFLRHRRAAGARVAARAAARSEAIDAWRESRDSNFDMTATLRVLFNSDFFKNARFQHMKSPAEVVVSTLRLVGGHELPRPGYGELAMNTAYMGQDLLNPPSVEGWHTGKEWINSGSLMARVNFCAEKSATRHRCPFAPSSTG
jgi:hypothetical protein